MIDDRKSVDMDKVRRMLAMLTEMTRQTGYIVGTNGDVFVACDSVFTVSEDGGYGLFLVRWDRDRSAYWVEDNAPRVYGDE